MAEKKSGFRFRLPWLLQPALPPIRESPTREPSTQPPRTTTQTPVPSAPAQRPPFRPPGKAPAPPPSAPVPPPPVPPPFSPRRSPPQSVASPPPTTGSPKSSVPKSIAKAIEPVASAKETQAITETPVPATPPQTPPFSPTKQAQAQPSPPQTPEPQPVSPKLAAPKSPTTKPTEPVAAQPVKETQTTTEAKPTTETSGAVTPPLTEPVAAKPAKETQTTIETIPTVDTVGPSMQAQSQTSPPQTPQPAKQSQTHTPPKSPYQLASEPANKPSSPPSPLTKTIRGNHIALDETPRQKTESRGTQTQSMDLRSMDLKSRKPKLTVTRVPLHREIKDDISKFIHNIATSSAKQSMDEKPASVVTIAGENTGASMHLGLDEIKRGYKLSSDTTAHDAAINGDSNASEDKELKAIVNSNIQGINNSMMLNSSVTERNPGVHLGFYHNQANMNDSMMKNTESIEMQKAEMNITTPQKLVYDPTMEASEFDFEEDDLETSGYKIEVN